MWTRNLACGSMLLTLCACGTYICLANCSTANPRSVPGQQDIKTRTTGNNNTSASCAQCWTKRGSIIQGSRQHTQAGTSVAISDDGKVVSIEEYGDHNGSYIQNGTGTGRLRLLQWDDVVSDWRDVQSFTEGLSQEMRMSRDGLILSTLGFNITNDSPETSNMDLIVQVYARSSSSSSSPMVPRGSTFSKANGLRYYPTTHTLSSDGVTLALSGLANDNGEFDGSGSRYQVYRYDTVINGVAAWSQLGNDIISVGDMVVMALSADGGTLATLGLQVNADFTTWTITGQVWDYQQQSSSSQSSTTTHTAHTTAGWTQRGEKIILSLDPDEATNFSGKLSDDGQVLVIFAREQQDKQHKQHNRAHNDMDKAAFIHPYVYHPDAGWVPRGPKPRGDAAYGITPSLAMSGDANVIVVGSIRDAGNNNYHIDDLQYNLNMFHFDGSQYVVQQQIQEKGFPVVGGLAISTDGTFIVSANPYADDSTGAVQVLQKCNNNGSSLVFPSIGKSRLRGDK